MGALDSRCLRTAHRHAQYRSRCFQRDLSSHIKLCQARASAAPCASTQFVAAGLAAGCLAEPATGDAAAAVSVVEGDDAVTSQCSPVPWVEAAQQQQEQQEQQNASSTSVAPLPPAAAVQRRTPSHSQVRRCRTTYGVCHLLEVHGGALTPRAWCTALCHLSELVGQGQQLRGRGWQQLRTGLDALLGLSTAGPLTGPAAAEPAGAGPAAVPPIRQFSGSDLATLLWAAARLHLQLPPAAWPPLLHQADAVSASHMLPRDTALLVWALGRLRPPLPLGWVRALLARQAEEGGEQQQLARYEPRSLLVLLHGCVLLGAPLPWAWQQQLVAVLQPHLTPSSSNGNSDADSSSSSSSTGLSGRDLAMLAWALPGLGLHQAPPASFLRALLLASRRHLPSLSCAELAALLVGIARLRYLPPGRWMLEVFDQLYWTADQLAWRQLVAVLWALGRLQQVGLPAELLDRLMAFVGVKFKQEAAVLSDAAEQLQQLERLAQQHKHHKQHEQQQHKQARHQAGTQAAEVAAAQAAVARARFRLARQLSLLLCGLAGLRRQLGEGQARDSCAAWLLLVLDTAHAAARPDATAAAAAAGGGGGGGGEDVEAALWGPSSSLEEDDGSTRHHHHHHLQVAASLHAAAQLGVLLPPAACARVLRVLGAMRDGFPLPGAALALSGAVRVGCVPEAAWLRAWLAPTQRRLDAARVSELHMLLRACVEAGHAPAHTWWCAAAARLQHLAPQMSGSNCVAAAELLLGLLPLLLLEEEQAQEAAGGDGACGGGVPHQAVVVGQQVCQLVSSLAARVEVLEVQRAMPTSLLAAFERHRLALLC